MKESNGTRQKECVILCDYAVEKRLPRPRSFDDPALITHDRLENPQAFAGRDNSLGDHLSDDRRVHSRLERGYLTDGARILVAVWHVMKQIAGGHDAESPK